MRLAEELAAPARSHSRAMCLVGHKTHGGAKGPKSSEAARVEADWTESLSAPDGRKGGLELQGHKYAVEAGGSYCRL